MAERMDEADRAGALFCLTIIVAAIVETVAPGIGQTAFALAIAGLFLAGIAHVASTDTENSNDG